MPRSTATGPQMRNLFAPCRELLDPRKNKGKDARIHAAHTLQVNNRPAAGLRMAA